MLLVVLFVLFFARSRKRLAGFVDAKAYQETTASIIENRVNRSFAAFVHMSRKRYKHNEAFGRLNLCSGHAGREIATRFCFAQSRVRLPKWRCAASTSVYSPTNTVITPDASALIHKCVKRLAPHTAYFVELPLAADRSHPSLDG